MQSISGFGVADDTDQIKPLKEPRLEDLGQQRDVHYYIPFVCVISPFRDWSWSGNTATRYFKVLLARFTVYGVTPLVRRGSKFWISQCLVVWLIQCSILVQ